MKTELKQGDWCFHQYELKKVKQLKDGIADVSCGIISTSGRRLIESCRPLTMDNKLISGEFMYWDKQFRNIKQIRNWPDLSRLLESMWLDCIDDDPKNIAFHYDKLRKLYSDIKEESEKISTKAFEGITIF